MPKRIADIAEELGVSADDIVRKCLAEGVPGTMVRSGESTVGPGMEATIREWLRGPSDDHDGGGEGGAVPSR